VAHKATAMIVSGSRDMGEVYHSTAR
jgi:hypothetical protein